VAPVGLRCAGDHINDAGVIVGYRSLPAACQAAPHVAHLVGKLVP
jgi:hypothetical protein